MNQLKEVCRSVGAFRLSAILGEIAVVVNSASVTILLRLRRRIRGQAIKAEAESAEAAA